MCWICIISIILTVIFIVGFVCHECSNNEDIRYWSVRVSDLETKVRNQEKTINTLKNEMKRRRFQ